jgi:hypothetical protein
VQLTNESKERNQTMIKNETGHATKEAETETAPQYTQCRHCGEFTVHLFTRKFLEFDGDGGDGSEPHDFDGVEMQTDVSVFAHIYTNPDCKELQDCGIESPRELDLARVEADTLRVLVRWGWFGGIGASGLHVS